MVLPGKNRTVILLGSTLVTGGAEMVLRALALGLPGRGFETHVVCLYDPGAIGRELIERGVRFHGNLSRHRFDPMIPFKLARIFREDEGAVLVSLDHHDATFWGAVASRIARMKRRVLSVHSTGLWSKTSSFKFTDRLVLGIYDRVVALADMHAEHLSKREGIDPGKLAVIHNGIDTSRFSPPGSGEEKASLRARFSVPAGNFVVTIVAALRPEKNHEMFLEAAAKVSSQVTDCTFLIVGEGQEAGKLQRLSRELSLEGSVRFMGLRDDVADILAVSDACVLCSYPVVETFPLSVLEAMACGLPVVATGVGSIPEMLGNGEEGLIVPSGDIEALSGALIRLARDASLGREMGKKARSRVIEHYSETRMVQRYGDMLSDLFDDGMECGR